METKEVRFNLSSELLTKLKAMAEKNNQTLEEIVGKILSENANGDLPKPEKPQEFPSVALFKESTPREMISPSKISSKENSSANKNMGTSSESISTPGTRPAMYNSATMERQKQITAEMKELSLLIDTASDEEKKADYLFKYALLASELDALY